jgi:hypothetical protein
VCVVCAVSVYVCVGVVCCECYVLKAKVVAVKGKVGHFCYFIIYL